MKRNRNRVRTDKGYRTECGYSIITDFSLVKYVELEGSLADVAVGKTLACADDEILFGGMDSQYVGDRSLISG